MTTSALLAGSGALPESALAAGSAPVAVPGDLLSYSYATHQLTLLHNGSPSRLGRLKYDLDYPMAKAYSATGGLVFESGEVVEQLTPTGTIRALNSGTFALGLVVGDAGRKITWSESIDVDHGGGSWLRLVDERQPSVVTSARLPSFSVPVGMLDDGRVAVGRVFNMGTPLLWRPDTGQLRALHGVQGLISGYGRTLVLTTRQMSCTTALRNVDTVGDTTVRQDLCSVMTEPSPDGSRLLGVGSGFVGFAMVASTSTGTYDLRLPRLVASTGWSVWDLRWKDDRHVQLLATRIKNGVKREGELSCWVPVHSDPSCEVVRDLGAVAEGQEPTVNLVH